MDKLSRWQEEDKRRRIDGSHFVVKSTTTTQPLLTTLPTMRMHDTGEQMVVLASVEQVALFVLGVERLRLGAPVAAVYRTNDPVRFLLYECHQRAGSTLTVGGHSFKNPTFFDYDQIMMKMPRVAAELKQRSR